ncbi:MAG: helix-turn-helix transcriptional regulator [Microthrixaceae bacterium]|nr:helix-turn-helix transcriptional regulator [Microthrixaceae bacterium]
MTSERGHRQRHGCWGVEHGLAERADIHVTQIRRYEAGTSAPTLDALRNLAIALNITTDSPVFDPTERGPSDDLALHLEAIGQLDPDDQHLIRSLIEAILLRHDTRRWTQAS